VAIKVYGDDLELLAQTGQQIASLLGSVRGAVDVSTEQITGQPVLQVRVRQDVLARHGIPARKVMEVVAALGSRPLGEVVEGQLRFPLVARLNEASRRDAASIAALLVAASSEQRLPLSAVASVEEVEGPATVTREWGQRRTTVQANIRGRDVA